MLADARSTINKHLNAPSSRLREKVVRYRAMAQQAHERSRLENAKKYYEKILSITASLKMQSQVYADMCLEHLRQLKEYRKLALKYYREGNIEAGQLFWERIVEEGQLKTFSLAI